MKFKSRSADPVQGNDFLHKNFGDNAVRKHKEFKCFFVSHDPCKPIPTRKFYPNWKFYPFLNHILYVLHFEWLLGFSLAVDEKIIGFQGIHVDKMIISYNNEGGGFQMGALCDQGYTYVFFLRNEFPPK